ncbi:abortive infection AbiH-like protein [Dysgonomonas alginatilytica]|uniref:Abortive infection AbiH-like protein n=1 Tax=Dysgonomonas alginatilytica TaxID=1605892 RepID=A0A2V3PPM9_9BACT|nr:abortive infection AbiH-like protein [Dysgonomonas alginatilytica]
MISSLVCHSSLNNWCDIEVKYFELLNIENSKHSYFQNPKQLNYHFEFLKKYLEEYLIEQEKEAKPIESYQEFFSNIDAPSTLILNFNYTHTIEKLYQKETSNSKIIHIHGELENENNPIIFGYAASHEESRDLLGKNDKEYLRNIKKQLYKRTDNEHQLSKYLNIHENIYLSILGHSCGFSDKLILKQILNHKNINKDMDQGDRSIRIFYYKEYESYFETQVNIDRIMNDDERFRTLLVDFTSSDSTPQFDEISDLTNFSKMLRDVSEKEKENQMFLPRIRLINKKRGFHLSFLLYPCSSSLFFLSYFLPANRSYLLNSHSKEPFIRGTFFDGFKPILSKQSFL